MSRIIEVLVRAGACGAEVDAGMVGIADEATQQQFLRDPAAALAAALGVPTTLACMVVAPDSEPTPADPAERPAEDEPQPDADAA